MTPTPEPILPTDAELAAVIRFFSLSVATRDLEVAVRRLVADRDAMLAEVECERKARELVTRGLESVTELYDGQKREIRRLTADRDVLLAAARAARLELMHAGMWALVGQLDKAIADR